MTMEWEKCIWERGVSLSLSLSENVVDAFRLVVVVVAFHKWHLHQAVEIDQVWQFSDCEAADSQTDIGKKLPVQQSENGQTWIIFHCLIFTKGGHGKADEVMEAEWIWYNKSVSNADKVQKCGRHLWSPSGLLSISSRRLHCRIVLNMTTKAAVFNVDIHED